MWCGLSSVQSDPVVWEFLSIVGRSAFLLSATAPK